MITTITPGWWLVPVLFFMTAVALFAKALTGKSMDEEVGPYTLAVSAAVGFLVSGLVWIVLWTWLPDFS